MNYSSAIRACIVGVLGLGSLPFRANGQGCHGTPHGGGLAFEHGGLSIGKFDGGSVTVAGNHAAIGGTYRYRNVGSNFNGHEGATRLSLILGISRLQLCPTLGLDYQRNTWTLDASTSIISNRLAGRGGINAGLEIPLGKSFLITPFGGAQYEFTITDFETPAGGETNITGDTLSHVDIEYGAIVRFKSAFVGVVTNRYNDFDRPYMSRILIGFAFGAIKP
jgi:hypothetical protein